MLKKNSYMKELLYGYDPINWPIFAKLCRQSEIVYPGIPKDINDVIVYYRNEEWLDVSIESLNGYTPRELSKSFTGRMILKTFLMRMPQ